jgi:hypothetical protein
MNILFDALESINKRWGHISTYRLDQGGLAVGAARWSNNVHHLTLIWDLLIRVLPAERRSWFATGLSAAS